MTALSVGFERVRARVGEALDRPSPLVKQSAAAGGLAAALVIITLVPEIGYTNLVIGVAGVVMVVIATALAAVFSGVEGLAKYVLIIPSVDIIGLGFFRAGTGGSASLFSSLILLPVVWLAASNGRRYVVYAGLGTSIALMMPYLLTLTVPQTATEWLRGVFTPIIFAVAAGIVNELARQSRAQLKAIAQLADEKEAMLQRTVEYAAQLQESEAKFRAADRMFRGVWAAVTEQSVIATDPEGLIEAWNPGATKLLGPTAEETEDLAHIFDFHVAAELDAYAKDLGYPHGATVLNPGFSALVEHARQGPAENREWTYVRADGTQVPVLLSVTARRDEQGGIRGYLFIASDQTTAREVSKLKDEFVGLISHELRTPLSSILGYLELLRDDDEHSLAPEQLAYLAVAERNANRLLRLVGDLLFTAQVESGRFPLDLQDVDLVPIVSAAVESVRPVADQAGVAMVAEVGELPVLVRGDMTRLGQAVDNLISNAVKFTPRGGSVTVELDATGSEARIVVNDTGLGIPEDELELLFGRFFRASTATRNAVPGVGLGLTITKAIVSAHGGTIEVASTEGEGTAFTITLPRAG
jgi:signal transduction histidine kinase